MCIEYFVIFLVHDRVWCLKYLIAFTRICCDFSKCFEDTTYSPEPVCEISVIRVYDEKSSENDFSAGRHIESKPSNDPIVHISDDSEYSRHDISSFP